MLRKCLKYDLKAIFSTWWIGAVIILVLTLPLAAILGNASKMIALYDGMSNFGELSTYETVITLCVFAYIFAITAFGIFAQIIQYMRYYSNFFKEEGYLTFTLPVKRRTLFLSKTFSSLLVNVATHAVVIISIIIIFASIWESRDGTTLFTAVQELFAELFNSMYENIGAIWTLVYVLEAILLMFFCEILSTLFIFFLITIGSSVASKHKIFAIIGIIYGVNLISSILVMPTSLISGSIYLTSIFSVMPAQPHAFFGVLLLMFIMMLTTACAGLYCVINGMLERKLNLP